MTFARNTYCLSLACLLFLSYSHTKAQNAKEIVSKYKSALGVTADQNAIKTCELKGVFIFQKLEIPAKLYTKEPSLMRLEMSFQNLKFLQISNDSLKYEFNPMDGTSSLIAVDKTGKSSTHSANSFDYVYNDLLNYQDSSIQLTQLKSQRLDSIECYVLRLTKKKNAKTPTTIFLNKNNFLPYKIEDEKGYRYFANYIHRDNMVFPMFVIDSNKDNPLEATFTELTFNSNLADTLFIIPERELNQRNKSKNLLLDHLSTGDRYYNSKRYDSALIQYTKAIDLDGTNYRAYNARGLTKIGLAEYYDAIADFSKAATLDPTQSNALNNRGLAKFYLGDKNAAIKDYSEALTLAPESVVTLKNRGHAYLQNTNYEAALADFSLAIKLKPDDGEAHFKYGVTQAQVEHYEDALLSYNQAIFYNFKTAELYNYKGVSEYKMEYYDSASVDFKTATLKDPSNLQYLENYGRALYEEGKTEEASSQFELYIERKNDAEEIYNLLGLCRFKDENYKSAIKLFTKAIELKGTEATYFDNRAASKEMLEDYAGAIEDYSESIRLYPNDASVFYKRGLIKIITSKKTEGCQDLVTAHDMKYEPAKEAILKNCN
jgi:tetratricopeptide (TPR) repeat protein